MIFKDGKDFNIEFSEIWIESGCLNPSLQNLFVTLLFTVKTYIVMIIYCC